jgi:hypothetical protein
LNRRKYNVVVYYILESLVTDIGYFLPATCKNI